MTAYLKTSPSGTVIRTIHDEESCGAAWIKGYAQMPPDISHIHFTADDLKPKPGWWGAALEATDKGFIPAAVVWKPGGGLESGGGDLSQPDNANRGRLDPDWSPVDFTGVPFLTTQMYEDIGMIPIHYYSDVWVSYVGRFFGYETALRTSYSFVHYRASAARGAGYDVGSRNILDGIKFRQTMIKRFGKLKP